MHFRSYIVVGLVWGATALFAGLAPGVQAQTGPGGVGSTDGASSLELWLQSNGTHISEDGTGVDQWSDQSGNGNDATRDTGDPQLLTNINTINDHPAVEFDGNDGFTFSNADAGLQNVATGANTVFVVSTREGTNADGQYILSIGDDDRLLGYEVQVSGSAQDFVGLNKGDGALLDNVSTSEYVIASSLFPNNGAGDIDALFNAGEQGVTSTSGDNAPQGSTELFLGQSGDNNNVPFLNGQVAEIIVYSKALNAAEVRIVLNHLAAKFGQDLQSEYDYYGHGTYFEEVAGLGDASSASAPGGASGPGVATSGSDTDAAESSILSLNGTLTDAFALFGHDGASASTYASSGNPDDAERIKRTWRVDLTGTSSESFSASVDLSGVSQGADFDDYGLFVDGDGDFTTTDDQTFHDLQDDNADDTYDASNVSVEDGDHIAVAQINRKVEFANTSGSAFENTTSSPNATATLSVNYLDGSAIDVDVTTTGDLDDSGCIEDDSADENPDDCSSGTNGNGEYEAGDGDTAADDDQGSGSEGSFAGDYRFDGDPGTPRDTTVSISGGTSSTTVHLELDDDGLQEQTEKFAVNLSGVSNGRASLGSETTFEFSIFDDDWDRDIKFADPDYTDGDDSDSNYNPTSTEGDGGGSRVEPFTVKLRQDGDGETAASNSPYTSVEFSVDDASEVNVGTDLSDPLVDVRIKDESGSDGTEYQERLSTTSGRIYFASDARSSTLKLEINEDELEDADSEKIVLNLENPVSGGLVQTDSTSMTFAIQDDDAAPNVSLQSTIFSGDESEDAALTVELDQQAGTNLDVTFEDDGSGSATSGDDYTWPSDSTISISSGKTTGTFSLTVDDDSETEANETIDVSLTSTNTDATLGAPSSATYTIVDNDGVGSTGPAGVGHADGSGSLKLWLRGGEGVYSSDDCTGTVSDGTGVGCWQDQSGYGNNATQGTADAKPAFQTGVQNGYPVVRFDSTSGTEKDVLEHSLTSVGNGSNTIFALAKTTDTGAQQGLFSVTPLVAGQDSIVTARTLRFASTDAVTAINGNETAGATGGTPGTNPVILSSTFTSDNTTVDVGLDGSVVASNTGATESGEAGRLGAEMRIDNQENITNTNHFDGDVAEVVAYETALNAAQRNIVRNYLAAKYNVTLSNNDLYAGDADAGQYDHSVIGIGQEGTDDITDAHTKAEGGGLSLSEHSISDGDYVLLGNQAEIPSTDSLTYEGTGGLGGDLAARPDSTQYLSITGSPAFNLTYDLSEIGLKGTAGDASGYVLIHADPSTCTPSNNDCSWSDAGGSVSVNGDNVTFSDVSLGAGDYYLAIGTVDAVNSPLLNTYARTVEGEPGTDGADAGWRYVGVPVTGAVIDDVQPPVSPNRNGFVSHSVAMDYHWSLDDGGSNTDGWTELHSGDAVPNGRGFLVYLYDDSYYPIDTELPLDVGPNDGTPGDANVTVGDNTPGTDTPLNQDSTWHLLANPYATSFDLTNNLSGPGGSDLVGSGFSSTIQLWDPDQETYVTKTQGNDGDNIAEWQGFFVERSTTGQGDTELTFASGGRDAGSVDFVGSKASSTPPRTIGLRLLVHRSGKEVARDDAANILFRDGAGPGWDGHDASKLRPFTDKYATIAPMGVGRDGSHTPKATESRPHAPEDTLSIPLYLDVHDVDGTMTLRVRDWTNIPAYWPVTLVDLEEDRELPFGPDTQYEFTVEDEKKGGRVKATWGRNGTDELPLIQTIEGPTSLTNGSKASARATAQAREPRFVLRIEADALPARLQSMEADVEDRDVILKWTTASETRGADFYVEHRVLPPEEDSVKSRKKEDAWREHAFVEGKGAADESHTYEHRISDLPYGDHAFRLRQVDTSGTAYYTREIETEVYLDERFAIGKPYPNPSTHQATVEVTVREKQPVEVGLYDVLGRRVRTVRTGELAGQRTRQLQVDTGRLASGLYFLRVDGKDFMEVRRMMVVH